MLNGPPVLAPGGGAEVLPAGLLDSPDSLASSWFANNGFVPFQSAYTLREHSSATEPEKSTSVPTSSTAHHEYPAGAPQQSTSYPSLNFPTNVDLPHQPFPDPPSSTSHSVPYSTILNQPSPIVPSPDSSFSIPNNVPSTLTDTNPPPSINAPSALGLPVYSTSGFDLLSILSRITNRPNPTIHLGPVDFSCSFAIADVRRHDSPIVYASPTFYRLTGYSEHEVLGRNCRFLQSPTGHVSKGEPRRFASPDAVAYMRKSLASSKECQTSLINYRKGGQAFINLVTVIPLRGGIHNTPEEADEVAYHVGFQVDLTEQPNRILEKLRDGSYCVSYSACGGSGVLGLGLRGGKNGHPMSVAVSKDLRNLIADTTFTDSVPISTSTNISGTSTSASGATTTTLTSLTASSTVATANHNTSSLDSASTIPFPISPSLSLLLLEFLPDFLLVLSLKGSFLYVAPSVRLVLGYEPHELVGRSIADVCHPADLVPLMRELKEGTFGSSAGLGGSTGTGGCGGSGSGTTSGGTEGCGSGGPGVPKPVDLLFRAQPKTASFSRLSQPSTGFQASSSYPSTISSSNNRPSTDSLFPSYSTSDHQLVSTPAPTTSTSTQPPYIWLECRGRLHVEPGKGRKAIILSGRARWMPVVKWEDVSNAGGVGVGARPGSDKQTAASGGSTSKDVHSNPSAAFSGNDPLEFWSLHSPSGTFLVASAGIRDVLGWGVGEVIGRSLWGMVSEGGNHLRESVMAELAQLDVSESQEDPSLTIFITSLTHKDFRIIPVRIVFYRIPRSHTHAQSLVHPLNNLSCPIVCQVSVLPVSSRAVDPSAGLGVTKNAKMNADKPLIHSPSASLFEELDATRGSSWQYELQQLKFANQRLYEELDALEGASIRATSSSAEHTTAPSSVSLPSSSGLTSQSESQPQSQLRQQAHLLQPQPQPHYSQLMHPNRTVSAPSNTQPQSLRARHPSTSDWSLHASNSLKRAWQSEDGPTT
ncbi:hypothetical protein F5I97DRAFT_1057930 [Phlebopus sp. FC_14]|nr:hypothetical protein F5I97DRAFT_1057930 [Phlebopus sp. FC_14]